jgi:hypothetical protein
MSIEENFQYHCRVEVCKALDVRFVRQWLGDPETRFTIGLVSGEI